jgi:hypothetical protein
MKKKKLKNEHQMSPLMILVGPLLMHSESENEREKLERTLDDHKKLLYPNCEDGQKKLDSMLELLQWKAETDLSDKGFEKVLKIIKKMLSKDNNLPASTHEEKKIVCPNDC